MSLDQFFRGIMIGYASLAIASLILCLVVCALIWLWNWSWDTYNVWKIRRICRKAREAQAKNKVQQ